MGTLAALIAAMLVALVAPAGEARAAAPIERSCVAYGSLAETPAAVASAPQRWNCADRRVSLKPERTYLRFALPAAGEKPQYATFRRAEFARLHLMVVDADGAVRTASYGIEDTKPGRAGAFIRADLPEVTAQSRYAIAAFDLATHPMLLETAQLAAGDPIDDPAEFKLLLLLAMLCGMLMIPLAFNLAFYRVLRESFLLWHATLASTLLTIVVLTSGLSRFVVDLDMGAINTLMALIYGAAVSAGGMFAWSFIEPGKLHPLLRRALPICAVWSLVLTSFHAFFPYVLRPVQIDICYTLFLPVLGVFFATVVDAARRGSRAVKFQIVGWIPLMLVVLLRIVSQLVPAMEPTDAMLLIYFGIVFEAVATTLGVTDRFLAIRRERDQALTEAGLLERLSEHDPLTGLLNRRAIEPCFDELRKTGFDTFALLDLDHFKLVNDEFGHAVGDKVLRAVAEALDGDPDMMAVRMGGEEFGLVLRGENARDRAERTRQSIPVRVARAVPELDRMVTASMGLLELPRVGLKGVGFKEFYSKADKLLYEAKSGGRNRLIAEKMRVFMPRRLERRRAA